MFARASWRHQLGRVHFRRAIGRRGVAPGCFMRPHGVAVVRGSLVVSEWAGGRLQVLTLDGVPLQVLPLLGSALAGMCVTSDGRVWVADGVKHAVHVLGVA